MEFTALKVVCDKTGAEFSTGLHPKNHKAQTQRPRIDLSSLLEVVFFNHLMILDVFKMSLICSSWSIPLQNTLANEVKEDKGKKTTNLLCMFGQKLFPTQPSPSFRKVSVIV